MNEETIQDRSADSEIQDIAKEIGGILEVAFDVLIERRDTAYAAASEPLDSERENLVREHGDIGAAAGTLRELLPARARQAQFEADRLMLEGKSEEARTKLEQMREAESAPGAMQVRQDEIAGRIKEIDAAKRATARLIFGEWYVGCQHVIRAAETGLFVTLLDGLRDSFFTFQSATDTGPDGSGLGGLFNSTHFENLTAPERSAEWRTARTWYGGRR